MRTHIKIHDVQVSLFKMGQERGRYLKDVQYSELCQEEVQRLGHDAEAIVLRTQLELRLVLRQKRKVWRFMNRNGL